MNVIHPRKTTARLARALRATTTEVVQVHAHHAVQLELLGEEAKRRGNRLRHDGEALAELEDEAEDEVVVVEGVAKRRPDEEEACSTERVVNHDFE